MIIDVFGDAVFDDDVLVGTLQEGALGYTFLAFQEPEFQGYIERAIGVAKEYGLPVIPAERGYIINDGVDTYGT